MSGDFTLQIGGSVIRSPYGVEVTWKKTLFTKDGDKTTKYFLTQAEQEACIRRVKSGTMYKKVKKVKG